MKLKNIALAGAILFSGIAQAGIIYPTQNFIGVKSQFSSQRTSIFYIDNTQGTKNEEYTVAVEKWIGYDKNKGSILEPTEELKVFPEHVIVPAGKRVPVKVLLKKENPSKQEYYRINFKDDPTTKKGTTPEGEVKQDGKTEGGDDKKTVGVKVIMPFVYSIPIFSQPADIKSMVSEINKSEDGKNTIVKNTGNVLYRIDGIKKDGVEKKYFHYLFPGETDTIEGTNLEIVGRSFGLGGK